ncbi:unnamed protein product [Phytophthora fragariaefolia]|uniref:Unnamed protein product n=1 Tax=Phytophthora fragariaefolia TaxID=1490495 RepID=A0A9W6Y9S2_9STRA|nr:unnamed protein product [Phytophthora fragariaefolia]
MMKCSLSVRFAQSLRSCTRSSSSAVQNETSAFLYTFHTSCSWIGNSMNRFGFSTRNGSGCSSPPNSLRLYSDIWNVWWRTTHRESMIRDNSVHKEGSELGAQVVAILEEEFDENLLLQRPTDFYFLLVPYTAWMFSCILVGLPVEKPTSSQICNHLKDVTIFYI